jgi:hypothetical protein
MWWCLFEKEEAKQRPPRVMRKKWRSGWGRAPAATSKSHMLELDWVRRWYLPFVFFVFFVCPN